MQLKEALDNIPVILQYFIPGYIALSIFLYLSSKKAMEAQSRLLVSVVISYVLIATTEAITNSVNCLQSIVDSVLIKSIIAIIFGMVGSFAFAWVFKSRWFSILVVLFNKTPNDDIWMDVLNFKQGSNLKIYEKGCDYYITGHHFVNEEKGNDSWFAVTAYSKIRIKDEKVLEDHSWDDKAILAVRLSDVDHMEIFNPSKNER